MKTDDAGMVFQQFNLFPQMTALENVMFGPIQVRGATRAEARDQALIDNPPTQRLKDF